MPLTSRDARVTSSHALVAKSKITTANRMRTCTANKGEAFVVMGWFCLKLDMSNDVVHFG